MFVFAFPAYNFQLICIVQINCLFIYRRANSGNNKTKMDSVESAKIVVIHGRKRIVVKEVFNEFCDSSTIHGLKYLGTRPTHEKYVNIGAPSIFRHYTIIVYSITEYGGFWYSVYPYVCVAFKSKLFGINGIKIQ